MKATFLVLQAAVKVQRAATTSCGLNYLYIETQVPWKLDTLKAVVMASLSLYTGPFGLLNSLKLCVSMSNHYLRLL